MIVLGLDLGDRRIGVAVADLDTRTARPLVTLSNNRAFLNELTKLQREHNVQTIVIGWPTHITGQPSAQTKQVQDLSERIRCHLPEVELIFEDERMTSKLAATRLRGTAYRKGDIDAVSAQLILEGWLSHQPSHPGRDLGDNSKNPLP